MTLSIRNNNKYDVKIFEYIINVEEALKIRKLIHGEQHEAVATVLQELGDLMDDLGEYESAMSFYIDALDIRRSRLGLDDIAVAETLYRYVCVSAQKQLSTLLCSLKTRSEVVTVATFSKSIVFLHYGVPFLHTNTRS